MSANVKKLLAGVRAAEALLAAYLKKEYSPGTWISWSVGDRTFSGAVTMNCHGDRLKVRNDTTGKERFISAYQIVS